MKKYVCMDYFFLVCVCRDMPVLGYPSSLLRIRIYPKFQHGFHDPTPSPVGRQKGMIA